MRYLLFALFLPTAAIAGVEEVIDNHILPAHKGFATATAALSDAATADCRAQSMQPAFHAAFDAWMGISHITFGPMEELGLMPSIVFWPDTKNSTGRHLERLIAARDQAVDDPAEFGEVSIAARGLFALERLLYDPAMAGYGSDSYSCALVQAISGDLAHSGQMLLDGWQGQGGHARTLRHGGAEGNLTYLSSRESVQAIYTALSTGLEFDKDQRLGRPLGTFERPRPRRAEARRSARALRNVTLSLRTLRDMADQLTDGKAPQTLAAIDHAIATAQGLDDPAFQGVSDPVGRLKVEILQQSIEAASIAVRAEIGPLLGVSAGFNALDGD